MGKNNTSVNSVEQILASGMSSWEKCTSKNETRPAFCGCMNCAFTSLAIIAASLLSTSDINLVDNAKHVLILNSIPTAKKICGLTLFLRSQFHLYCCKYP
jgi:hypothetical protein